MTQIAAANQNFQGSLMPQVTLVREFSAAGPCLTLGMLVRETEKFYVFYPWRGGRKFQAKERRIMKCLPGRYSGAHTEACHSCRDHAQTQYPRGYMD